MPFWPENIEERSLDEMFRLQASNRAWSKQLRQESQVLVNNRLAKVISMEEYSSSRELAAQQSAECRRRAESLSRLIESRGARPLPQIA